MKQYKSMSAYGYLDEDVLTWFVREMKRTLWWLSLFAEEDNIKPKWWEYESMFHNLRWDVWITVMGEPHV